MKTARILVRSLGVTECHSRPASLIWLASSIETLLEGESLASYTTIAQLFVLNIKLLVEGVSWNSREKVTVGVV